MSDQNPPEITELIEHPLSSREVYKGKLLHVFIDDVRLPDGNSSTREWINHPGACAVVPVFEDGSIMLVRQYRYPVKQIFIEVPAGKIDPGEPPLTTATRETAEETGLHAENIAYVSHFYPVIGYSNEVIHVFVAWGLTTEEIDVDEDEFLITMRVPFSKALEMIHTGEINDGKTICALLQTKMWWEKHRPFDISF